MHSISTKHLCHCVSARLLSKLPSLSYIQKALTFQSHPVTSLSRFSSLLPSRMVLFLSSKERRKAREEHASTVNKMFYEENDMDGTKQYNLIEHIKHMCGLIDGFIYVADAEGHKSKAFPFLLTPLKVYFKMHPQRLMKK